MVRSVRATRVWVRRFRRGMLRYLCFGQVGCVRVGSVKAVSAWFVEVRLCAASLGGSGRSGLIGLGWWVRAVMVGRVEIRSDQVQCVVAV